MNHSDSSASSDSDVDGLLKRDNKKSSKPQYAKGDNNRESDNKSKKSTGYQHPLLKVLLLTGYIFIFISLNDWMIIAITSQLLFIQVLAKVTSQYNYKSVPMFKFSINFCQHGTKNLICYSSAFGRCISLLCVTEHGLISRLSFTMFQFYFWNKFGLCCRRRCTNHRIVLLMTRSLHSQGHKSVEELKGKFQMRRVLTQLKR